MTKATDDKVKEAIYVGVAVRANKKQGYELRVFPKAREWELRRNGERIDGPTATSAIEGLAKKNRIQLQAVGSTVTAKVNGQRLIQYKDKSSDGVGGRKNALVYGDRKDTESADGEAFFDKLKVQIPAL